MEANTLRLEKVFSGASLSAGWAEVICAWQKISHKKGLKEKTAADRLLTKQSGQARKYYYGWQNNLLRSGEKLAADEMVRKRYGDCPGASDAECHTHTRNTYRVGQRHSGERVSKQGIKVGAMTVFDDPVGLLPISLGVKGFHRQQLRLLIS